VTAWTSGLRPASFRGVPFAWLTGEADLARRTAVHEYPFREDGVWVEDLGQGRNAWQVAGRLVGDDVASLLQQMQEAVQQPGTGELIHPLQGSLTVACIGFRASEAWDNGRVVELDFLFVRASERRYPASATATAGEVASLADAADAAAEGDFLTRAKAAFSQGKAAVEGVVKTARNYVGMAQRFVGDATSTLRSVTGLIPGADRALGRFIRPVTNLLGKVQSGTSMVSGYVNRAASARSSVERLGTNLEAAWNRL